MDFTKPAKHEHAMISECSNIYVDNQDHLVSIENDIIMYVTEHSLEWFKKNFRYSDIKKMYTPEEYKKGLVIKGLVFNKQQFKLDVYCVPDFFDHESETPVVSEPVAPVEAPEPVEVPVVTEPVEVPVVTEPVAPAEAPEPVDPYKNGQVVEILKDNEWVKAKIAGHVESDAHEVVLSDGSLELVEDSEIKPIQKRKNTKVVVELKEQLLQAVHDKDVELAFKISKILKQLRD